MRDLILPVSLVIASVVVFPGCSRDEESPRLRRVTEKVADSPASDPPGAGTTSVPSSTTPETPPASTRTEPAAGPSGSPPVQEHTGILEAPGAYLAAVVGARYEAKRKIWLVDMGQRIQAFEAINDRKPQSLAELAHQAPLPVLPDNLEFSYDPKTGAVDVVDKK